MWLTNVSIKRPLFILMVIGALLVVGLVSWTKLGVDLLPALDFPIVVVSTPYPGASPEAGLHPTGPDEEEVGRRGRAQIADHRLQQSRPTAGQARPFHHSEVGIRLVRGLPDSEGDVVDDPHQDAEARS